MSELFSLYLKMLVLYSPFFVLSCFIGLSRGYTLKERKRLAWKVALATLIASVLLYLFGQTIFEIFGITADAFRIGAGSVLFISALGMAQGKSAVQADNVNQDVTIVPLTIPLTVGPGTIGALLVMEGDKIAGIFTERDYARKVVLLGRASIDTPISEVMTRAVRFVHPTNSAEECMALMTENRLRHLPVMDGEQVVGLVSIGDLVKSVISEQQFIITQMEQYITRVW